jgi:hypothetical protein
MGQPPPCGQAIRDRPEFNPSLKINIITTVAGNGSYSSNTPDGVVATSVSIYGIGSIFADQSSNLFLVDGGHSRIRKVAAGKNLISTVAGNGSNNFSGDGGAATAAGISPNSLAIDRNQNLYIRVQVEVPDDLATALNLKQRDPAASLPDCCESTAASS